MAEQGMKRFYGYIIIIIAIIAFLISMSNLIGALIDLSDPLHAGRYEGPSLASFETYKMDMIKELKENQPIPDDETIKAMYKASMDDRIHTVRFQSRRSITVDSFVIFFSVILFLIDLIWMRKVAG
jgi:hypothetical protein